MGRHSSSAASQQLRFGSRPMDEGGEAAYPRWHYDHKMYLSDHSWRDDVDAIARAAKGGRRAKATKANELGFGIASRAQSQSQSADVLEGYQFSIEEFSPKKAGKGARLGVPQSRAGRHVRLSGESALHVPVKVRIPAHGASAAPQIRTKAPPAAKHSGIASESQHMEHANPPPPSSSPPPSSVGDEPSGYAPQIPSTYIDARPTSSSLREEIKARKKAEREERRARREAREAGWVSSTSTAPAAEGEGGGSSGARPSHSPPRRRSCTRRNAPRDLHSHSP